MRIDRNLAVSLGFLGVALILYTPFSLIDFDPHHDGYMLAQAIALNDGGLIHLDAFAQYGPMTPWFQSIFTWMFSEVPAIGLRLSNVVVLALTTFVIADFGRNMPSWWPIKQFSGRLAALIWLLTADFFYGVPMLPWSSALATFFALSSIYFFGRASNQPNTQVRTVYFCLAGSLAAATTLTRINVGLPLLALVLVLTLIAIIKKVRIFRSPYFLISYAAFSVFAIGLLATTNSLNAAFEQAVLWPLRWSDASEINPVLNFIIISWNLAQAFLVPITLICLWVVNETLFKDKWPGSKKLAGVTLLLSAITIILTIVFEVSGKPQVPMAIRTMPFAFVEKVALVYQFLTTAGISVTLLLAVIGIYKIFRSNSLETILPNWALIALCGIGFSTIIQISPVADSRHIWWGLPPILLVLINVFSVNSSSFFNFFRNPLVYGLSVLVIFAPLISAFYIFMDRDVIKRSSVAEGMRNFPSEALTIEGAANAVKYFLPEKRTTIFLVDDGYISVADGKYRSQDRNFVSWGPVGSLSSRLKTAENVVIRNDDLASKELLIREEFLLKTKFAKYEIYAK